MNYSNIFAKVAIGVCFALLFFVATYFGKAAAYIDVFFFSVGILFGIALLEADEMYLHKFYADETTSDRQKTTKLPQLMTRSVLFLLLLFPLGLFLITSTGSAIGVGFYLGIVSGLAYELFTARNDRERFHTRFMYQLKRHLSTQEQNIFTYSFIGISILFAFLVIFLGR